MNIVDAHTSFVYASSPPVAVDGESWSILLLQMKDHGHKFRVIVSDGGKAIGRAVREIAPDTLHQRDVWHVLHEWQKVQERIDRAVKALHQRTPAVERNGQQCGGREKTAGSQSSNRCASACFGRAAYGVCSDKLALSL